MTGPGDGEVLSELRVQARQLVAEVAGPLRRIYVRRGDAVLEVEWHGAPPDGPTPALADGHPVAAGMAAGTGRKASGGGGVSGDGGLSGGGAASGSAVGGPASSAEPDEHGPRTVVSPMVGTFYRAPEPGAAPFVEVGDVIQPDRVVGIVEAMKLMNEITAGQPGRVVDLLVADGQPVEFGQPLIALAPV